MSNSFKPVSAAALTLALMAMLGALALPVAAQDEAEPGYGDWQMRCEILVDETEQCALTQFVRDEDREGLWLRAYAFRPAGGDGTVLLSVLVPLQVILTEKLGLRIDRSVLLRFDFITCAIDGCLVSIELSETLRAALGAGREALFIYYFERDVGVGIPVSLDGLAAGLEALP